MSEKIEAKDQPKIDQTTGMPIITDEVKQKV